MTLAFFSHENINTLFKIFREKSKKIGDWLKPNKLSLNIRKTKDTVLHKQFSKDDLPSK